MRGSQPLKTHRSRVLRSAHVSAEDVFWRRLGNRRLGGFKFVRQAAIGAHFADFLFREMRLIIEVDGGTHGEAHEITADAVRDAALQSLGYRIVRVSNSDVYSNIEGVLDTLLAELEKTL